jgi:hypothetical protein
MELAATVREGKSSRPAVSRPAPDYLGNHWGFNRDGRNHCSLLTGVFVSVRVSKSTGSQRRSLCLCAPDCYAPSR